jgi:hypothetical protein
MRTCVCLGRHFANDTIDKVRQAAGRLRGDARGRDGGVREELAAGIRLSAVTENHRLSEVGH